MIAAQRHKSARILTDARFMTDHLWVPSRLSNVRSDGRHGPTSLPGLDGEGRPSVDSPRLPGGVVGRSAS